MVERFWQLTNGMDITYFADGMDEPIPQEVVDEQLDRFSGMTSLDGYFKGLDFYKISIQSHMFAPDEKYESGNNFWNKDRIKLSVIGWFRKDGREYSHRISQFLAAESKDELTLDQEVGRVSEFVPARFLDLFPKDQFGVLPVVHYSEKRGKLVTKPSKRKYTTLQAYWGNETRPVLLSDNDAEKCRVLTEFAVLAYSLQKKVEQEEDKRDKDARLVADNLCLTKRAASNLLRSIQINSRQLSGSRNLFAQYDTLWSILG